MVGNSPLRWRHLSFVFWRVDWFRVDSGVKQFLLFQLHVLSRTSRLMLKCGGWSVPPTTSYGDVVIYILCGCSRATVTKHANTLRGNWLTGPHIRLNNIKIKMGLYTLPMDQTIHNRIISKVCCNVFTCRIRNTWKNQHNILLWITVRSIFKESHDNSLCFLKLSFSIAFFYESSKISYSVLRVWGCNEITSHVLGTLHIHTINFMTVYRTICSY